MDKIGLRDGISADAGGLVNDTAFSGIILRLERIDRRFRACNQSLDAVNSRLYGPTTGRESGAAITDVAVPPLVTQVFALLDAVEIQVTHYEDLLNCTNQIG